MIGIIGGTGFIGLNLTRQLSRAGIACRTFSRNGLLLDESNRFHRELLAVEHVRGDLGDKSAVEAFVRPCEQIIMLASHLLPASSAEEVKAVTSWFSPAFVHLLECCVAAHVQQLVFVSSGGTIYGENPAAEAIDEAHPLNAHSAYGSFCAFLEQLIRNFHFQYGLPFTILRLGNPYGVLKRPNKNQGIIDHYIRSARAREPFTIFGDGTEMRDYIYIDDVSRALTEVVVRSQPANDTFNVGTGRGHTSSEVITLINRCFELPTVPVSFTPRRLGDLGCSILSMAKFSRVYGIQCEIGLETGLTKYRELEAAA